MLASVNLALRHKRGDHMTPKEKTAWAGTRTASETTLDREDSTATDPVKGWYSLGQAAKERKQKAPLKKARKGEGARR